MVIQSQPEDTLTIQQKPRYIQTKGHKMKQNVQLEIPYNKENFIALLADRTDTREKIFSLQREIKKLNAEIHELGTEITLLSQPQRENKEKNSTKSNTPWNKIIKLQK